NLSAEFQKLSDKDTLGISLIEMRDSLQRVADSDTKRNWATTGLANLGETLRTGQKGITDLYDKIVRFIVKYTESNQG
ncbi:hypothetical protein ACXWP3_09795, partial [Streptococcus pyogenes]